MVRTSTPLSAPRAALALTLCAVALCWAGAAQAKDLNGMLGIGIERSLGGVSGLALRYWPTESLGVHAALGLDVVDVTMDCTSETGTTTKDSALATTWATSFGAVYNFAQSLHANLGIGARLAIGYQTKDSARLLSGDYCGNTDMKERIQFVVEIPLVLEFFLSDNFSFSASTGFMVTIVPSSGAVLDPQGHGATDIPGATAYGVGSGSITGTVGAMYYF